MKRTRPNGPPTWPLALALVSASVTAAEIALMQLLSCMQWHHFAYLVVAVALLGFGASGTVLSLWQQPLLVAAPRLVPWLMIGSGAGFAAVVALLQWDFLRFDLYLLFVEPGQWVRLAAACLLLAAPFFCAGLATALILTSAVENAGRLYFANLTGAGVGAVAGLALLELFPPAQLPALTAMLPLIGAMVLGPNPGRLIEGPASAGQRMIRRSSLQGSAPLAERRNASLREGRADSTTWCRLVVLACVIIAAAFAWRAAPPAMSPFKDLARTLDLPDARLVLSQPSAQGWLQIVDAPALRGAPPADLAFAGRVPHQLAVFLDGNRYGSILDDVGGDALNVFAASVEALPWRLAAPRRVLFLHEGAGGEAAFAVRQGAEDIALVEPHRKLARVLQDSGATARLSATIRVRAEEPRLALARHAAHYDLIRFPTAGTFGGSAGLRAVGEEFLLTREAIAAAWRALTDDGTLLVTAWMDHPERTSLRLLATLVAGLDDVGIADARTHLAAVRGWASVTFLLRRTALDTSEVTAIRSFCDELGFDPLLLPGLRPDERDQHHAWDNAKFFAQVDAIVAGTPAAIATDPNSFRLDAPTDERPYFSQFLRPAGLPALARTHGLRGLPFVELGSIVVAITFGLLLVLATVLIVLPLARRGWNAGGRGWTFACFAALGAGFMLLEIVLMLRLTSFAGGPIPAAAIVLATLLVGAGIGSRWSQRWHASRASLGRITLGAAVGILMLGLAASALPIAWDVPTPVRAFACAASIAPAACVMGMAFPTGLRFLAAHAPAQVPWAWAINNCVSVVTPSLATLLAVSCGYSVVFALAAAAYAVATLAIRFATPKPCTPGG